MRDNHPTSSETESNLATGRMFNLNKLNNDRPEVVQGVVWRCGQIPKSPNSLIESLVQRVDKGRFRFEIGSSRNGSQLLRPQALPTEVVQDGNSNLTMGMGYIGTTSSPNQEAYIDPTVSFDTGLENLNILDPFSLGIGPPSLISTCSNPFPLSSQQDRE
nr:hypothetical protein CFP56_49983 [Quercus suber]